MNHSAEKRVTVYRPNQRHELGFFQTWVVMAQNVMTSRELIWQLFKRDFLAAYKKSFLGKTWIMISPLIGIISWVFLQKTGMLKPGDVGIPYPAYVLIGNAMWGLFMGFYSASKGTLTAGSGLLLQVNYPHEALLFKQIAQQLADFTITFGMNLIILFAFGVVPSWTTVFFPIVILPLFFFSSALGLMIAMISVVIEDMNKLVGLLMGLWIWITPIIYSNKIENPLVQMLIKWNPLTYLVCSARDIIIYGRLYDVQGYCICAGFSFVFFLISWRVFYVSENKIIERMI